MNKPVLIALAGVAAFAVRTAPAAEKITLRNSLAPDLLLTYEINTALARTADRAGVIEKSAIRVKSKLVRAHFDENTPGRAKVADMLVTDGGTVLEVRRDEKPVSPLPGPEIFNLPSASATLKTTVQTWSDGPAHVPPVGAVEKALLTGLLDVAHWPKTNVELGYQWSRQIDTDVFSGRQSLTVVELTKVAAEVAVVVEVSVDGKFIGPTADAYKFDQAKARLLWSRGDRILLRLEGLAHYTLLGKTAQPCGLTVEAILKGRQHIGDEQQSRVRKSLGDFANALAEKQAGRADRAVALCAAFREAWPDSPWLPAVEQLERQVMDRSKSTGPMAAARLKDSITELVLRWQAAIDGSDTDLEARTRRGFTQLVTEQESGIRAMLKDKDDAIRAQAVFAWAFGDGIPHYLDVVQATADSAPRVRAWATHGLAARANANTDPAILKRLLADDDAAVRARACFAVGRCMAARGSLPGSMRQLLNDRLMDDQVQVRIEAAKAFGTVGAAVDAASLRTARDTEKSADCQKALDKAIEQVSRRG